jgi:LmbE family N-acetylglucosaminyl deacetylase
MQPQESPVESLPGPPGRHDIYLSPHSDDVCFSIGALARSRGAGTLLTVFTISSYRVPAGPADADATRATTHLRMAEDVSFANACGLQARWLGAPDASVREQRPFDSSNAISVANEVGKDVIGALVAPTIGRVAQARPWLFCPAGIGRHVDHIALTLLVTNRLELLAPLYRIAFYEDLHYASNAAARDAGLQQLRDFMPGRELVRHAFPLRDADARNTKKSLVEIYASQLTPKLREMASFVPAVGEGALPHEAVWLLQGDAHQRPG